MTTYLEMVRVLDSSKGIFLCFQNIHFCVKCTKAGIENCIIECWFIVQQDKCAGRKGKRCSFKMTCIHYKSYLHYMYSLQELSTSHYKKFTRLHVPAMVLFKLTKWLGLTTRTGWPSKETKQSNSHKHFLLFRGILVATSSDSGAWAAKQSSSRAC